MLIKNWALSAAVFFAASSMAQTDLIISEYVEGSSHTKCIELYNPTSSTIDLRGGDYRLVMYPNGSTSWQVKSNLTGLVEPGGVHVICEGVLGFPGADQAFAAGFNGDDAVAVIKGAGDALVDLVGNIGCDPGSAWKSGEYSTKDRTLRRRPCVNEGISFDSPNCAFSTLTDEWMTFPTNDLSGLGHHHFEPEITDVAFDPIANCGGGTTITLSATGEDLEYSIDDGKLWQPSGQFDEVVAGTYQLKIREKFALNCQDSWTPVVELTDPAVPDIQEITVQHAVECGGSGAISFDGLEEGTYSVYFLHEGKSSQLRDLKTEGDELRVPGLAAGTYSDLAIENQLNMCLSEVHQGPYLVEEPEKPDMGGIRVFNAKQCTGTGSIIVDKVKDGGYDLFFEHDGDEEVMRSQVARRNELVVHNLEVGSYTNLRFRDILTNCISIANSDRFSIKPPDSPQPSSIEVIDATRCDLPGALVLHDLPDGPYRIAFHFAGEGHQREVVSKEGLLSIGDLAPGEYSQLQIEDLETDCKSEMISDSWVVSQPPLPEITKLEVEEPQDCGSTGGIILSGLEEGNYNVIFDHNGNSHLRNNQRSFGNKLKLRDLAPGTYQNVQVINQSSRCRSTPLDTILVIGEGASHLDMEVVSKASTSCHEGDQLVIQNLDKNAVYDIEYLADGVKVEQVVSSNGLGEIHLNVNSGRYSHFLVTDPATSCVSLPVETEIVLMGPKVLPLIVSLASPMLCGGMGTVALEGLLPDHMYDVRYTVNDKEISTPLMSSHLGSIELMLDAGSYEDFSATDVETGCTSLPSSLDRPLTLVDTPSVGISQLLNPSSCATNDGSIVLQVDFSDTDYEVTYAFKGLVTTETLRSEPNANEVVIPNLEAGVYTNISVALNGCRSEELTALLEDIDLNEAVLSQRNPSSCMAKDGALIFTNLPFADNITVRYTIDGINDTKLLASSGGQLVIDNLGSGYYEDIVLEFGGCLSNNRTATLSSPEAPRFDLNIVAPSNCGSADGTIALAELAPGDYDVFFRYDGIDSTLTNQSVDESGMIALSGLETGLYADIRLEQSGCTSRSDSALLLAINGGQLFPRLSSESPSDCRTQDAAMHIGDLKGHTPYLVSYDHQGITFLNELISDSMGRIIIPNLIAGTYEDVHVNLGECVSEPSVVFVPPPTGPPLDVALLTKVDPSDCASRDGSIILGTFGPHLLHKVNFSLSGGARTTMELASDQVGHLHLTDLGAGAYENVEVSLNGCQGILSQDVVLASSMGLTTELAGRPPSCNAADGEIEFSMLPPNATFVVTFDSMGVDVARNAPSDAAGVLIIGGLGSASYSDIVVDGNGCLSDTMHLDLFTATPSTEADLLVNHVRCFGESNGFASIDATGGDIGFSWSHDPTIELNNASNLLAGDYRVTVSRPGYCDRIIDVVVRQPSEIILSFSRTDPSAPQSMDGALAVTAGGGAGGYSYKWSTGQTDADLEGLSAGLYSVTVTDQNGCSGMAEVSLGQGECMLDFDVQTRDHVACAGDSTGSLVVTPTSGLGPFTFQWSHDEELQDSIAEDLWAGTYAITVTDALGCIGTFPFFEVRDANPPLVATVQTTSTNGEQGMDGSAAVDVMGGVADYTYLWSTGATSSNIEDLSTGSYWVKVTDALGCTDSTVFEVDFVEETCRLSVVGSKVDPSCTMPAGGSIELMLSDPDLSVETMWLHDLSADGLSARNLSAGVYEVVVNQGEVCADTLFFELLAPAPVDVQLSLEQDVCSGDSTSQLEIQSSEFGHLLVMLDGNTIEIAEEITLPSGMHTIRIENEAGCSLDTNLLVRGIPSLSSITQDTQIKLGHSAHLQVELEGDGGGLDFGWRVGDTILCSGCLAVDVVPARSQFFEFYLDFGDCELSDFVQVFVDRRNLFFIPNAFTPNNDGINDHLIVHDGRNLIQEVRFVEVYDRVGRAVYKKENFSSNIEQSDFAEAFNDFIVPAVFIYRAQVVLWDGSEQNMSGDFTVWK